MQISIEITTDKIWNAFVSAFEGGSNYWSHEVNPIKGGEYTKDGVVWWGHEAWFAGDWQMELRYDQESDKEGDGTGRKMIGPAEVKAGLEAMVTECPTAFGDLISEFGGDAVAADAFLQCVVFGKVIYG